MLSFVKRDGLRIPRNITALFMSTLTSPKPPNILVHTGRDCVENEDSVINVVKKAVGDDKYVVYSMKDLGGHAWRKNTALLIQGGSVDLGAGGILKEFLNLGGRILMLSDACVGVEGQPDLEVVDKHKVQVWRGGSCVQAIKLLDSSLADLPPPTLSALLLQYFQLHCPSTPSTLLPPSSGYLVAGSPQDLLEDPAIATRLQGQVLKQSKLDLDFSPSSGREATEEYLPVLEETCPTFDQKLYLSLLSTRALGRTLVYCPVIGSSMAPLDGGPLTHGFTVVPRQQTSGRGRGGNSWLSPVGCAMFSLQLHLNRNSHLGRHVPFVQHLVSLSQVNLNSIYIFFRGLESFYSASLFKVHSIRQRAGYGDLDVRLKWPNDTYYGSGVKLGGVITTCQTSPTQIVVNIGSGINLFNDSPTVSLNAIIRGFNEKTGEDLPLLRQEDLLATTLNQMEDMVEMVNDGRMDEVKQLYYRYWLHGDQHVTVKRGDKVEKVVIKGIDDFGFLEAEGKDGLVTIHPDGNSFDMMEGLIAPK